MRQLNDYCTYYAVETRSYEEFETQNRRFKKHSDTSYSLINAGSIFLVPEDQLAGFKQLINNQHAAIAGFNHIQVEGERN